MGGRVQSFTLYKLIHTGTLTHATLDSRAIHCISNTEACHASIPTMQIKEGGGRGGVLVAIPLPTIQTLDHTICVLGR